MSPSLRAPSPTTTTTPLSSSPVITILSKVTVFPHPKPSPPFSDLKLSVSDLPMLSCHYIQKGLLFPPPSLPLPSLFLLLSASLSRALSLFPPLAGRLRTDSDHRIFISCSDADAGAGADFTHAAAPSLSLPLLTPPSSDIPFPAKSLFPLDLTPSYDGHFLPLSAFQLTALADASVFLACAVNHAVVDGTSFWNFFNAWAELCRSPALPALSRPPDFRRNFFPNSPAVLRFPAGGKPPSLPFPLDAPLRERIFHFTPHAIQQLKSKANVVPKTHAISSFQSLCAQLWKSVTRARTNLQATTLTTTTTTTTTTFRMAVNCRRRIVPPVDEYYFGNAIQSIPTTAAVGEVAAGELRWIAGMLHRSVAAHGDERIRKTVSEWEAAPGCFPLGNPDGAGLTMGSSPRFPMYEGNDFGWGGPLAVLSGRANKFDGKISAFPGREGRGSVDLEVCLAPETMAGLLEDEEFMYYVNYVTEEEVNAIAAI